MIEIIKNEKYVYKGEAGNSLITLFTLVEHEDGEYHIKLSCAIAPRWEVSPIEAKSFSFSDLKEVESYVDKIIWEVMGDFQDNDWMDEETRDSLNDMGSKGAEKTAAYFMGVVEGYFEL